jgi:hypothetical protein
MNDTNPPASITIRELGQTARNSLEQSLAFVKPRAVSVPLPTGQGLKWHLFLDQPADVIESCAVACGITILIACGEPLDSEVLRQCRQVLLGLQLPSGGWTSWVPELTSVPTGAYDEPLILDTFYAVRALQQMGDDNAEQLHLGLEWIREAHNASEGGWGFYKGDTSHTLTTSYAIRVLAKGYDSNPIARDIVHRGIDWLLSCAKQNNDGGWGKRLGEPSSAVHTALALLALMEAGFDKYSPPVVAGRDWLLTNQLDVEYIIDYYVTPGKNSLGNRIPSRAINHINFPEGLVLQGLLASGTNLLEPRLLTAVQRIINCQEREGYWKCLHSPKDQPIYAIMDACLALRPFVDQVERHESVLEVSERIQMHDALLIAQTQRYDELIQATTSLNSQYQVMQRRIDTLIVGVEQLNDSASQILIKQEITTAQLDKLEKGLMLLRPVMWLTRRANKYPLLAVFLIVLIPSLVASTYVFFTLGETSELYVNTSYFISLILIAATVVTFWFEVYKRHN